MLAKPFHVTSLWLNLDLYPVAGTVIRKPLDGESTTAEEDSHLVFLSAEQLDDQARSLLLPHVESLVTRFTNFTKQLDSQP